MGKLTIQAGEDVDDEPGDGDETKPGAKKKNKKKKKRMYHIISLSLPTRLILVVQLRLQRRSPTALTRRKDLVNKRILPRFPSVICIPMATIPRAKFSSIPHRSIHRRTACSPSTV